MRTRTRRTPWACVRYGVRAEMRWAIASRRAGAVLAHSMLLDFGTGPFASDSIPSWNCSLLLAGIV